MEQTKRTWTLRRKIKTLWVSFGVIFVLWQVYSMQAHGVDDKVLQSDNLIIVDNNEDYYAFTPLKSYNEVFIFYPGALVQTKAYAPLCRKIAEHNIQVYLIKMPWRQATMGYNKPKELKIINDPSKSYILAGHSQGGKMAAQFVYENPDLLNKLILIATTHPRDFSLSDRDIPILKIYGSNDGVADMETMFKNRSKLPDHTNFVEIKGGNHAQFGYYGSQLGDNSADIDRNQQQQETITTIMEFIRP